MKIADACFEPSSMPERCRGFENPLPGPKLAAGIVKESQGPEEPIRALGLPSGYCYPL
jgi:hypothetical protein